MHCRFGWLAGFVLGPWLCAQQGWFERVLPVSPGADRGPAMVFDSARGEVVLFRGEGTGAQTWNWDGSAWTLRSLNTSPPPRVHAGMVFDSNRNVAVMFGGNNPVELNDTWEWNGTGWSQPSTGQRPAARFLPGMAFDPARGVTLLFGGLGRSATLSDTWEWNGQFWNPTGAIGPSPRLGPGMVFDPLRQRTVLFGGYDTQGALDDTWSWDGNSWSVRTPAVRPTARHGHRLVWDADRNAVLLFGGSDFSINSVAWVWNGTTWSQLSSRLPAFGLARQSPAAAWDPLRRRLLVFGGFGGGQPLGDTWELVADNVANYENYGPACASPAGSPYLGSHQGSLPWSGSTFQAVLEPVSTLPGAAPFGIVGDSSRQWGANWLPLALAPWGMNGCFLLTNPVAIVPLGQSGGRAIWSLPIPSSAFLIGMSFYLQAGVPFPGANPTGIVTSNGCRIRVQ
ncbi:MAG: hypothetical protein IPK26_11380 [Planctomycetes bacterium]|nr:hypothetical protein [Planctomycetota bacterium]